MIEQLPLGSRSPRKNLKLKGFQGLRRLLSLGWLPLPFISWPDLARLGKA